MKKNLEKIFASCSIVVAIILIMVLVVTAFGGIEPEEFDSQLVRGFVITLAILYLLLSVITLVLLFINNDVVKEIILRQEKGGAVRVTTSVVSKLVKKTCKDVEGVKCQKVAIVADEYGVRLKVNVKVVDKDVVESETYVRTLLEDVFYGEFGFKFSSIEIKVMALTPKYKANPENIQAKVDARLAQLKSQEEQEEVVEVEEQDVQEPMEELEEEIEQNAEQESWQETDALESEDGADDSAIEE